MKWNLAFGFWLKEGAEWEGLAPESPKGQKQKEKGSPFAAEEEETERESSPLGCRKRRKEERVERRIGEKIREREKRGLSVGRK